MVRGAFVELASFFMQPKPPPFPLLVTGRQDLGLADSASGGWLSLVVFAVIAYGLIRIPVKSAEGLP